MSRWTIERTHASPGNEIDQARSRPSDPPTRPIRPPSMTKRAWSCQFAAPTAFMMPISRRRSRTLISIVLAIPSDETSRATPATHVIPPKMSR